MNAHNKHSAQATMNLFSMRGKSWSFYQKHVANLIDFDLDNTLVLPSRATADVQRLDLTDCNLYGVSPSDPGPMVLCNQCNHIMAPEGIMRHVKRVHGSKIVPAPNNKLRIPLKGSSTVGSSITNVVTPTMHRITNSNSVAPQGPDLTLSTEFSNRLNVSKMAPPTPINASAEIVNAINSSSSNSNSPISLSKISISTSTSASGSGSGSSSRRNRKVLPVKDREYDPEKHCGVRIGNIKPCTRSLTCKTHQISLRRNVEGRSKPFDQLLADHRNNAKETHKHSISKQTNYAAGEHGNQLLESIGDSNSSSSFDMERRSFSSNSNQSTLGNYNSDHSTAFSTTSQQLNGTHSLPSVLSSITSATSGGGASTPNFTYSDVNIHRKGNNAIPFTPSPDDRTNTASQIGDLYNSNTMSAMQSNATNTPANHLNSSGLNNSASLANLGDYSMQMNDLINDDNGDGLDMTFWENFDNFNYEADLVMSNSNNSNNQQGSQLQSKSSSKRSHDISGSGSGSERKRKRLPELKDYSNHSKSSSRDLTKGITPSSLPNSVGQPLLKTNSNLSQHKKSSLTPRSKIIDSTPSQVICIDDDDDDNETNNNNNTDATLNRNSDKENGTIYSITPTKELSNEITGKQHVSRSHHRSNSATVNGTQTPDKPLTVMTLSSDSVVNSTDLVNVTKILSEADHKNTLPSVATPVAASAVSVASAQPSNQANESSEANDNAKSQTNQNLASVPLGENENFLLDMVYKCLRGKGVRVTNSNYSNSSSTSRSTSDSNRIREKENSIETPWSDDDVPTVPVTAVNSPMLPSSQRFSSSKCAYVPRAIATNHFNMARGRGICHVKHSVDCTKKIQQQIFHRIQTQQHNGTFAGANMIALRNNGSIMRLNSANFIGCSNLGSITNALNAGVNNLNSLKATMANATMPIANANTNANNTNNTNANVNPNINAGGPNTGAKLAFKKPVHFVNSIAAGANGPIVLLNPGNAGGMGTAAGNPRYAIFRRPVNQSIQFIARPTIDPSNSYSVMPVIHRVRTRTLKPNLPKQLETDRLLESLKSIIRPQKINHRNFDTTKKVLSVYQSLVKAANQPNHHLSTSTNSSSSSKRKSHSSLSNHKSSSNHNSQTITTSSSSQKQNGHSHNNNSNGGIVTSGTNYLSSHASTNSSMHIDKRTHIRIANDANHK